MDERKTFDVLLKKAEKEIFRLMKEVRAQAERILRQMKEIEHWHKEWNKAEENVKELKAKVEAKDELIRRYKRCDTCVYRPGCWITDPPETCPRDAATGKEDAP